MNKEVFNKYNDRIYLTYRDNVREIYQAVMYPNTQPIHKIDVGVHNYSGVFTITNNTLYRQTALITFGEDFNYVNSIGTTAYNVKNMVEMVFYG